MHREALVLHALSLSTTPADDGSMWLQACKGLGLMLSDGEEAHVPMLAGETDADVLLPAPAARG